MPTRRLQIFVAQTEQHHMPSVADIIGIIQRVDSHPTPGATLLMGEIRWQCPLLMQDRTAMSVSARR